MFVFPVDGGWGGCGGGKDGGRGRREGEEIKKCCFHTLFTTSVTSVHFLTLSSPAVVTINKNLQELFILRNCSHVDHIWSSETFSVHRGPHSVSRSSPALSAL